MTFFAVVTIHHSDHDNAKFVEAFNPVVVGEFQLAAIGDRAHQRIQKCSFAPLDQFTQQRVALGDF